MDDEIVIVTSSKDSGGVIFYDMATACPFSQGLKNCLCPPQAIATVGGISSYSGKGSSCGDFIVAAQSMKPQINVWQWGKPQALMQCHVQEITTAVAVDSNGFFLLGGTKGGRLHAWEITSGSLVTTWQGHFKAITSIKFTPCGNFCISSSEDGMVRVWDVVSIMSSAGGRGTESAKKIISPFRSWTPHSLPITGLDLHTAGGPCGFTRVMTVSVDRSLVVHDMFTNRQCALIALPEALTCCASNTTFDFAYAGSSSGRIYIVTLSPSGAALATAHARRLHNQSEDRRLGSDTSRQQAFSSFGRGHVYDADILLGHGKPVVGLAHSGDNVTLVSVSVDGDLRMWNTVTRQCTKIISPFSKNPISNVLIVSRPEVIDSSGLSASHRPTLCTFGHLKKYQSTNSGTGSGSGGMDRVEPEDREAGGANQGRRVLGYTRQFAHNAPLQYRDSTSIDSCDMDAVLGVVREGVMSEVDDMMSGDMVALPSFSDEDSGEHIHEAGRFSLGGVSSVGVEEDSSSTNEAVSLRGMLKRQDTFGDEFYDNWEKVVTVQTDVPTTGEDNEGVETCLSTVEEQFATANSAASSKVTPQSNKGGGSNKRLRYHEAVAQQLKQEQEEEDRQREEDKKQLQAQQQLIDQAKEVRGSSGVVRSAAAPPKMKRGKKK